MAIPALALKLATNPWVILAIVSLGFTIALGIQSARIDHLKEKDKAHEIRYANLVAEIEQAGTRAFRASEIAFGNLQNELDSNKKTILALHSHVQTLINENKTLNSRLVSADLARVLSETLSNSESREEAVERSPSGTNAASGIVVPFDAFSEVSEATIASFVKENEARFERNKRRLELLQEWVSTICAEVGCE